MKGFISACEQYNVRFLTKDIITFTTETRETIAEKTVQRLKEEQALDGIICYNDQIASLLLDKLTENGYHIPDDLSIVGTDDSSLSHLGNKKLTTLTHPKEKLGQDAARWIVTTIEKGQVQPNILYEPVLVERETVKKTKNKRRVFTASYFLYQFGAVTKIIKHEKLFFELGPCDSKLSGSFLFLEADHFCHDHFKNDG